MPEAVLPPLPTTLFGGKGLTSPHDAVQDRRTEQGVELVRTLAPSIIDKDEKRGSTAAEQKRTDKIVTKFQAGMLELFSHKTATELAREAGEKWKSTRAGEPFTPEDVSQGRTEKRFNVVNGTTFDVPLYDFDGVGFRILLAAAPAILAALGKLEDDKRSAVITKAYSGEDLPLALLLDHASGLVRETLTATVLPPIDFATLRENFRYRTFPKRFEAAEAADAAAERFVSEATALVAFFEETSGKTQQRELRRLLNIAHEPLAGVLEAARTRAARRKTAENDS